MPLIPGLPYPLGATLRDGGVNFAVASEHATNIELCTLDEHGLERREPLPGHDGGVWHGFLADAGAGLRYGYRAHGPNAPSEALRFDPTVLLIDPYGRELIRGTSRVAAALEPSPRTSVRVPAADTILYELHVKGFSKLNPAIPEPLRGTFAGLGHPASIEHLRALGVTTVGLLPVHHALTEPRLVELGLTNYWGYNTLSWFCLDPRLSATPDDPTATRLEFRAMVEALHAAGLEVTLDVVFNHSAEAGEDGPTLSLRGLDEPTYYRHEPDGRTSNWTGCGNTLDFSQPRVVQLTLDSLRYLVDAFGVDGFRFDLAPVLGRGASGGFDVDAPLFVALGQDPTLARVKMIAEPWDLGPNGYRLGGFPRRWLEWNDRFRDGVRRYWLRGDVDRAELARRLAGSSDVFSPALRAPTASVNFVTAHDGFTLADLVAYARKHNLANGEGDRDGHTHNFSSNCGVEGPTADPQVLALRRDLKQALVLTLLLAQGTPMLLAGDELGHSQAGNNNAYCQDNPTTWIDWATIDAPLLAFVRRAIALRREQPALGQDRWLGPHPHGIGRPIAWLRPDGAAMAVLDWHATHTRALMVQLGEPEHALVVLFNPDPTPVEFQPPAGPWVLALASVDTVTLTEPRVIVPAHAVVVLARPD